MNLEADIGLRRGDWTLAVEFAAAPGETVALVGPNGAGKSSCLSAVAGLLRLDRGRIALGDRVFDAGPAAPWVPPEQRGLGVVFQDRLLFPHRTVLQNVAYGMRCRGVARATAERDAAEWIARVGLDGLASRRPAELSGGQAQRAALARALAVGPGALLLDEPLSAVDASGKRELGRVLRAHLTSFVGPRVVVVHDIADALALADRLVVVESGRVVQAGPIGEIVGRPRSPYVADLIGVNCFVGTCRAGVLAIGDRSLHVAAAHDGDALVTVHPRAVALFRERPEGSPRNVWRAPVDAIEASLDRLRVRLGGGLPVVAEVTAAAVADLGLAPGVEVWVAIKATEFVVAAR
jgi:molybdate transport system ATP-binding protein